MRALRSPSRGAHPCWLDRFGLKFDSMEDMLVACDTDGDGQLNYEEFVEMMMTHSNAGGAARLGDGQGTVGHGVQLRAALGTAPWNMRGAA